jgi:hypothetical protein
MDQPQRPRDSLPKEVSGCPKTVAVATRELNYRVRRARSTYDLRTKYGRKPPDFANVDQRRLSRIALFPKGFHQSATMINYAR